MVLVLVLVDFLLSSSNMYVGYDDAAILWAVSMFLAVIHKESVFLAARLQ